MLANLFDQIFGRSKCGKREIITTTIIEPESININDDDDDDDSPANDSSACCFLPSMPSLSLSDTDDSEPNTLKTNYQSQPQHKQLTKTADRRLLSSSSSSQQQQQQQQHQNSDNTRHCRQQQPHHCPSDHLNNQNRIRNNQNKLNEISIFSVYLLFATLFVCICTIAVLLFTYINRANDIVQLRDSLTSEFIARSDIDEIIRNVLSEVKNNDHGDGGSSVHSIYDDSNENIGDSSSISGRSQNNNNNNNHNVPTADGLELRWVCKHIYLKFPCRFAFATHFHFILILVSAIRSISCTTACEYEYWKSNFNDDWSKRMDIKDNRNSITLNIRIDNITANAYAFCPLKWAVYARS